MFGGRATSRLVEEAALKILALSNLYPPDFLGGYELACSQVVEALRGRGHDVRVLAAAPRLPVVGAGPPYVLRRLRLTDEWGDHGMGVHPVLRRDREARSRVIDAFNVHALLDVLGGFRPDVVYLNNLVGIGGLGLLGCLRHLGLAWLWHLGDYVPLELCSDANGVVPGLAGQFARSVNGHYIVVSKRLIDECSSLGVTLNGRVELVPYWISGERPTTLLRQARIDGPLRIISVGRLDPQKGTDLLIEAAALLRDSGDGDFSLDIYGRPADGSFAELVRSLRLDDHVRLMGFRPHRELAHLYGSYDLLAFPTRDREPFGLVALEAAARGCVPLVSRDCGVAEWLVHGVHCLKCRREPADLAEAIRGVIRGQTPLGPLARRAAEAAWRDFHIDAVLPRIEAALQAAADEGQGGGRLDAPRTAEAYRLARLAELLTHRLIQEGVTSNSCNKPDGTPAR